VHRHRSFRPAGAEIHRYFPEWADLRVSAGVQWEAERNSYSAGGYAEEFGYAGQAGQPRPAKPLGGDPELSKLWHVLRGSVHPGYPECARPVERESPADRELMRGAPAVAPLMGHLPAQPSTFRVIYVRPKRSTGIELGFLSELWWGWKRLGIRLRRIRGF